MSTPLNPGTHAYVATFQWQDARGHIRWASGVGGTIYTGASRAELYLHGIAEARLHLQAPEEAGVVFFLIEPEDLTDL